MWMKSVSYAEAFSDLRRVEMRKLFQSEFPSSEWSIGADNKFEDTEPGSRVQIELPE